MAQYRHQAVQTFMWHDKKFLKLSQFGKLLYNYLLTAPQSNMIGLYMLEPANSMETLGCPYEPMPAWFEVGLADAFAGTVGIPNHIGSITHIPTYTAGFWEGLAEIISVGMVEYDSEARFVFIKKYLHHNPIYGPNSIITIVNLLKKLTDTYLVEELLKVADTVQVGLVKGLRGGYAYGFSKGKPNTGPLTHTATHSLPLPLPKAIKNKDKDKDKVGVGIETSPSPPPAKTKPCLNGETLTPTPYPSAVMIAKREAEDAESDRLYEISRLELAQAQAARKEREAAKAGQRVSPGQPSYDSEPDEATPW